AGAHDFRERAQIETAGQIEGRRGKRRVDGRGLLRFTRGTGDHQGGVLFTHEPSAEFNETLDRPFLDRATGPGMNPDHRTLSRKTGVGQMSGESRRTTATTPFVEPSKRLPRDRVTQRRLDGPIVLLDEAHAF